MALLPGDKNFIFHGPAALNKRSETLIFHNVRGNNKDNPVEWTSSFSNAGNKRILVKEQNNPTGERLSYWSVPGRSRYSEMCAIVSVPWPKQNKPVLRPPAIGDYFFTKFLVDNPIFEEQVQWQNLPRVIDLSSIPNVPPISYYEGLFKDFCGDCWGEWSTDTRTPDLQHPGYGTYLASVVSQAMVMLCSKIDNAQKKNLAILMTQWGIDLASAFSDGRDNSHPTGGHMAGRKALVMLAGWLLKSHPLMYPNAFIGKMFMEDNAFTEHGWRHSETAGYPSAGLWDPSKNTPMSYIDQVTGSQIGIALGMALLGLTPSYGLDHFQWCDWWISDSLSASGRFFPVKANYLAAGMNPSFGEDYSVGGGRDMCKNAWKQYFG